MTAHGEPVRAWRAMRAWRAAGVIAIAACGAAQSARVDPENPAYLVRATPESRQAVARAVGEALAQPHVTLDDDALTRDGRLVVQRAQLDDPRGLALAGRDPGAPGREERFHLVKIGEHCVLVHDRTDRHFDLTGASCAPL